VKLSIRVVSFASSKANTKAVVWRTAAFFISGQRTLTRSYRWWWRVASSSWRVKTFGLRAKSRRAAGPRIGGASPTSVLDPMTCRAQRIRSCRIAVTRLGGTHVGARSPRTARPHRRGDREGREAAVVDCLAHLRERGGVPLLGRLGRAGGPEAIRVYRR